MWNISYRNDDKPADGNTNGAAIWEMASGQLCQEQRVQRKGGE